MNGLFTAVATNYSFGTYLCGNPVGKPLCNLKYNSFA